MMSPSPQSQRSSPRHHNKILYYDEQDHKDMKEYGLDDLEIFDPDEKLKRRRGTPKRTHNKLAKGTYIEDTETVTDLNAGSMHAEKMETDHMYTDENEVLMITEWDAYKELVAKYETSLNDLKLKLKSATYSKRQLEAELSQTQTVKLDLEASFHALEAELRAENDAEINELRLTIAAKDSELISAAAARDSAQAGLQQAQSELGQLRDEKTELQHDLHTTRVMLQKVQIDLGDVSKQLQFHNNNFEMVYGSSTDATQIFSDHMAYITGPISPPWEILTYEGECADSLWPSISSLGVQY